MNILNLSLSNLSNICTNLSNGINKYTRHNCKSICMRGVVPYNCDIDMLWPGNEKLVKRRIDESDVLHLNGWYFTGWNKQYPITLSSHVPLPLMRTADLFYKKTVLGDILLKKWPNINSVMWWSYYMSHLKTSQMRGKKVLLQYHGGDLRRVMSEENKNFINKRKLKVVVTIPDLLPQLNDTEWLPIPFPIDDEIYKPPSKRDDSVIKIVHSPTEREAKKTDVLIRAVNALKQKYDVELMLIENTPYAECLRMKKEAHISFDNIEFGSYAACSIEALCYEQPSLVYLNDVSLEEIGKVSNEIGIESPFINVGGPKQPSIEHLNKVVVGKARNIISEDDYNSVYSNLKLLIEDDSLRKDIGKRGRRWVSKVHEQKVVTEKLIKIYESLENYNGK